MNAFEHCVLQSACTARCGVDCKRDGNGSQNHCGDHHAEKTKQFPDERTDPRVAALASGIRVQNQLTDKEIKTLRTVQRIGTSCRCAQGIELGPLDAAVGNDRFEDGTIGVRDIIGIQGNSSPQQSVGAVCQPVSKEGIEKSGRTGLERARCGGANSHQRGLTIDAAEIDRVQDRGVVRLRRQPVPDELVALVPNVECVERSAQQVTGEQGQYAQQGEEEQRHSKLQAEHASEPARERPKGSHHL
ncbi:MAG: hypothetical protein WCK14_05590 [Actinomycetota bacterium]